MTRYTRGPHAMVPDDDGACVDRLAALLREARGWIGLAEHAYDVDAACRLFARIDAALAELDKP